MGKRKSANYLFYLTFCVRTSHNTTYGNDADPLAARKTTNDKQTRGIHENAFMSYPFALSREYVPIRMSTSATQYEEVMMRNFLPARSTKKVAIYEPNS